MTRRVVITGMGTVNSLCSDIPGFWAGLCAGRSGIGIIEQFDTTAFKVHFGGEVKDFKPGGRHRAARRPSGSTASPSSPWRPPSRP